MFKILFLSIKQLLKNNKSIVLITVFGIIISIILVVFSYGFTYYLEAKTQEETFTEEYLRISLYSTYNALFADKEWSYDNRKKAIDNELVKKKDVLDILCQFPSEMQDRIEYVEMGVKFKGDVAEDNMIDSAILHSRTFFRIQDSRIVSSNLSGIAKSLLTDGRYFTKEEEDEGSLVCIDCRYSLKSVSKFYIGNYYDENGNPVKDIKLAEKYLKTKNGTYIIDGKEYRCIGSFNGTFSIPIVPVSTLDNNVYITELFIKFSNPIVRNDYETISNMFQKKYGDIVTVFPLNIPEKVTARFTNTLLVICLLIAFLSGSITAFIYLYLLQRSARTFRIYRLCGMSAEQVRLLCFAEFISLQVFSVLIGLLGYHFIIMPILDKSLVYLSDAYNPANYIKLAALYLAISLSIVIFMMNSEEMRNTWVNM